MKMIFFLALLLSGPLAESQNLNGKWYGRLTQEPGGYRRVYNFELDIVEENQGQRTTLSGTSYAFIDYQIQAKIGFTGEVTGDTLTLTENVYQIQEETAPAGWVICIKTLRLAHLRSENKDFLRGRWTGTAHGQETACVPGLLILARNPKDLRQFVEKNGYQPPDRPVTISGTALNRGGAGTEATGDPTPDNQVSDLAETAGTQDIAGPGGIFENTVVSKLTEVLVDHDEVQFYLLDYSRVDHDSISVFLNRKLLLSRVAITEKPIKLTLKLDQALEKNELLFVADSQGEVPPNTAGIAIRDGEQLHKFKVQSDDKKSSAIYLTLRKNPAISP